MTGYENKISKLLDELEEMEIDRDSWICIVAGGKDGPVGKCECDECEGLRKKV